MPKKFLKLVGDKLMAEAIDEKPSSTNTAEEDENKPDVKKEDEKISVGQDGLAGLGNMSLDENVFEPEADPIFLERNPNQTIHDGGSPDRSVSMSSAKSPPRNDPVEAANMILATFEGALKEAQADVSKEASEAIESINRNLREVQKRSLVCLERELAVERREARMERERVRMMEMEMMSSKRPRGLWRPEDDFRGNNYRAKRPRYGDFPDLPGKRLPFANFVDDAAYNAVGYDYGNERNKNYARRRNDYDRAGREDIPWLHKGSRRLLARSEERRRFRGAREEADMPALEEEDDNDWRFDDPRKSRGPGGYKKRRGGRGKKARFFQQPPPHGCKPRRDEDDGDDDDHHHGGAGPRRNGRQRDRCHSNVLIKNNVRVNH